jgi:dihydrofolate reductase
VLPYDVGPPAAPDSPTLPAPAEQAWLEPYPDRLLASEDVEAAIEQARAAADGKDVSVMGADIPQQAIRAALLDELVIHLIPVLLDDGKRLFDRIGGRVHLERTQVVEAPDGVTHLRFRVIR